MTRKDYILIANAFLAARADIEGKEPPENQADLLDGVSYAVEHVADHLRRTNERFDHARFLKACGVKEG